MTDDPRELLNTYIGRRIPGGCDACDAYQELEPVDDIYVIHVFHDAWCPLHGGAPRSVERNWQPGGSR